MVLEIDGVVYPTCAAGGVVYTPPFTPLGLEAINWPDWWDELIAP